MKRIFLGLLIVAICCLGIIPVFSESAALSDITAVSTADIQAFGVAVAIGQPEYWTDFMPPGWRPPVIKMTLRVFNNSSMPVTFDFNCSQRYDFMIYNSRGVEVWRWSTGKAFMDVLGRLTLNPGQSVTYNEECKFVNASGYAMPVDLYTLRGVLTATDRQLMVPRVIEGKVSFWHRYVY